MKRFFEKIKKDFKAVFGDVVVLTFLVGISVTVSVYVGAYMTVYLIAHLLTHLGLPVTTTFVLIGLLIALIIYYLAWGTIRVLIDKKKEKDAVIKGKKEVIEHLEMEYYKLMNLWFSRALVLNKDVDSVYVKDLEGVEVLRLVRVQTVPDAVKLSYVGDLLLKGESSELTVATINYASLYFSKGGR